MGYFKRKREDSLSKVTIDAPLRQYRNTAIILRPGAERGKRAAQRLWSNQPEVFNHAEPNPFNMTSHSHDIGHNHDSTLRL